MRLGLQNAFAQHDSISRLCYTDSSRLDERPADVLLYQPADRRIGFNQQHDGRSSLHRETLRLSSLWPVSLDDDFSSCGVQWIFSYHHCDRYRLLPLAIIRSCECEQRGEVEDG